MLHVGSHTIQKYNVHFTICRHACTYKLHSTTYMVCCVYVQLNVSAHIYIYIVVLILYDLILYYIELYYSVILTYVFNSWCIYVYMHYIVHTIYDIPYKRYIRCVIFHTAHLVCYIQCLAYGV